MSVSKLALALLAGGLAMPALAAEPFNGPFVGGELGWQQDRLKLSFSGGGQSVSDTAKASGLRYGGFAGVDFRAGTSAVSAPEPAP